MFTEEQITKMTKNITKLSKERDIELIELLLDRTIEYISLSIDNEILDETYITLIEDMCSHFLINNKRQGINAEAIADVSRSYTSIIFPDYVVKKAEKLGIKLNYTGSNITLW